MNKHIIRLAIAGAGIVAGVCFAFVAGMKTQEAIEEKYPDPEERPTLIEKAKVAIPIFIPALCALFVAGGTLAAEVTGTQREVGEIKTLLKDTSRKKDQIKGQFTKYRGAVKEIDGEEKDWQYLSKASEIKINKDGEVLHTFKIHWLDEDLYFDATLAQVKTALDNINRCLCDYGSYSFIDSICVFGMPTVGDFLRWVGHPEMVMDRHIKAGWHTNALAAECDCYWLDFQIEPHTDEKFGKKVYEIYSPWGPEDNIADYVHELERKGII